MIIQPAGLSPAGFKTFRMRYCILALIFVLIIFIPLKRVQAQRQINIWYFGRNAGIDFNAPSPKYLIDSKILTDEGSSSIANSEGVLQIYTDGITVWNKNHDIIATGLFGNETSTQSALIVPHPANKNQYYIFTTDGFTTADESLQKNKGLNYSLVDLSLNGGKGGLISLNVNLFKNSTEKLTAVQTSVDCRSIWVIAHPFGSDEYHAYLVNASGVTTQPIISKVGIPQGETIFNALGYLKASPNGKKLAAALMGKDQKAGWLELYDFDAASGKVSNAKLLAIKTASSTENLAFYGLEFSPDNSKLYAAHRDQPVYQFDLNDLTRPPVKIGQEKGIMSLQLAPDGKIYGVALQRDQSQGIDYKYNDYLSVIHKPNLAGDKCDLRFNDFYLGIDFRLKKYLPSVGLPNFIQSYFYRGSSQTRAIIEAKNLCFENATQFNISNLGIIDKWHWDFDDSASGTANTSSEQNPSHTFTTPGNYNVRLLATNPCGQTDTVFHQIKINPEPVASITADSISVCYDQLPLQLEAAKDLTASYLWSNGVTTSVNLVNIPGWYRVAVTNACRTLTDSVYVEVVPQVQPLLPNDTIVCDGNLALLDARNEGASYRWNTGQTTRTIQVDRPGTYWVEIKNRCSSVVDTAQLYFIPENTGGLTYNVFTPNGDGKNDQFINYVRQSPSYRMQIFSRWGDLVFDTTNAHQHWDGTHQRKPLPGGVYYYTISTQDCRGNPLRLKGWVTLVR
jgi:gliding motility-associated-like protein